MGGFEGGGFFGGGAEKYIPASRSISVMGLSEGGYIGLASTSIVEV